VAERATQAAMRVLRRYLDDAAFRAALDAAPPGIVGGRSWGNWNLKLGRWPGPLRRIG
jgi:hypothetical protein